ncbi:MAG: sulfurtransferase TusA family protein, partial [bacterium]
IIDFPARINIITRGDYMDTKKTLDARGLSCPMPIVKLSQTIKEMDLGDIIEVLASDPSFVPDVEAWCRKTGQTLIEINETPNLIKAYIRKDK